MTFFSMLSKVEAEEAKQKTAIGKKNFELPAVGASDADAAVDDAPAPKKTSKKKVKESLPEGSEADNVLQDDEPDENTETEE